jgi:uncharacterized protein (TIGR02594 family)
VPAYLFNAKELDEENGMYYFEARYMKPPMFISRDVLFESKPFMSPYAYCRNSPLNMIDPSGNNEDWYENEKGQAVWDANVTAENTPEGGRYIGKTAHWSDDNYRFHGDENGNVTKQDMNFEVTASRWNAKIGTPWMDAAKSQLGQTEIGGAKHNPNIIGYHQTTTLNAKNDETAWCSSFVNWCITQSGLTGTNSAWAPDWANWGTKLNNPAFGSIGIVRFPDNGGRHVGFVVGQRSDGRLIMLGGNQSGGRVTEAPFPRSWFTSFTYPQGYDPNYTLPIQKQ